MEKAEKDIQTRANEHGKATVDSMRDDLEALEHAGECTRKGCKRGSETRSLKVDGKTVKQLVHSNPEAWHNEETAREVIEQAPLSVQVRSGWHSPGENGEAEEYEVLLGTGGPASRIIGDLGRWNKPESAHYEFQDWFTPWTRANLSSDEEEVLLKWVSNLYFGD